MEDEVMKELHDPKIGEGSRIETFDRMFVYA